MLQFSATFHQFSPIFSVISYTEFSIKIQINYLICRLTDLRIGGLKNENNLGNITKKD